MCFAYVECGELKRKKKKGSKSSRWSARFLSSIPDKAFGREKDGSKLPLASLGLTCYEYRSGYSRPLILNPDLNFCCIKAIFLFPPSFSFQHPPALTLFFFFFFFPIPLCKQWNPFDSMKRDPDPSFLVLPEFRIRFSHPPLNPILFADGDQEIWDERKREDAHSDFTFWSSCFHLPLFRCRYVISFSLPSKSVSESRTLSFCWTFSSPVWIEISFSCPNLSLLSVILFPLFFPFLLSDPWSRSRFQRSVR